MINKFQTNTRSYSTETPNPTSVEFNKIFTTIVEDALSEPDRKLIIALDNLDRIIKKDGLSLFSTLQPFMAKANSNFDKVWFILPYDKDGMDSIWSGNKQLSDSNDVKLSDVKPIAKSMIEKIIQITLHVPQLILSDWQKYIDSRLDESLIGISEEEKDELFNIFYNYMTDVNLTPTPRIIKRYINDLIGLTIQWENNIPLQFVAIFVLLRNSDKFFEHILFGFGDTWISERYDKSSLSTYLSMLWFNVERSIARQLLLESELLEIINRPDLAKFSELLSLHKQVITSVILMIILDNGKIHKNLVSFN